MTWTGNIILSKVLPSTSVNTIVTIGLTDDAEMGNNQIVAVTPPTTSAQYSTGKKDTRVVDLLRIEERIDITGEIATGLGTSDSHSNASDKKVDLLAIFKSGGTITITYEGVDYTGICERWEIRRMHKDGSEPGDGETGFTVKFLFLKGVNMVGGTA